MKNRFILFRRAGVFYYEDTTTGKQLSLRTKIESEAQTLLHAKNESVRQPALNLHIAKAYLAGTDSAMTTRTWPQAIDSLIGTKEGANQHRWRTAAKDKALLPLLPHVIIETPRRTVVARVESGHRFDQRLFAPVAQFLCGLELVAVALDSQAAMAGRQIQGEARYHPGGTPEDPRRRGEPGAEKLLSVVLALGRSQGDLASLKGEDVNWTAGTVSFFRHKTGTPVMVHLGKESLNLLKDLPGEGVLFPYLSSVRANDRATEFKSRCRQLGIQGVTLHGYRYAWAERAKTAGFHRLVPLKPSHREGFYLFPQLLILV